MFEATLAEASVLKKVLDAIKDLVTEANFDCNTEGISLQAMDTSRVALVSFFLQADGFAEYRCDRSLSLGINLNSLTKIMKCANSDDRVTIKADDGAATATFTFESPSSERVSQFTLKLMEINQQRLGIPQTDYKATVSMSSAEFQRISRDLSMIGDSVTLAVKKDSILFSVTGDIGEGNICLRQGGSADRGDVTVVDCSEPVTANFALKYFNNFTKATALSNTVTLQLFPGLPLNVQYKMDELGFIRFYLAPKLDDEEEEGGDM